MFPPDLPPVTNWPLYCWRVFVKWLSFFIFGLGSVLVAILVLPPMRLFCGSQLRFQKYGRSFISAAFRIFIGMMHGLGIVNYEPDNRDNYRNLKSKIIVANHPSLLDVVMLIAVIPNADCIVNAYLNRNILTGVVRQLYILNNPNFDELMHTCTESLKMGNCLIIFPEGTRTRRTGKVILKKGAARVALASGCPIVPVNIGGTDKFGLGKKDPWRGFNTRERYVYKLTMGNEISPLKYKNYCTSAAAKLLINDIYASIFPLNAIQAQNSAI